MNLDKVLSSDGKRYTTFSVEEYKERISEAKGDFLQSILEGSKSLGLLSDVEADQYTLVDTGTYEPQVGGSENQDLDNLGDGGKHAQDSSSAGVNTETDTQF